VKLFLDISSATPNPTGIGTYVHELGRRFTQKLSSNELVLVFQSLRQPPPDWANEWQSKQGSLLRSRIPGPLLLEGWRTFKSPSLSTLLGRPSSSPSPSPWFFSPATFLPPPQHQFQLTTTIHDLSFLDPQLNSPPRGFGIRSWLAHRTGPSYLRHAYLHHLPRVPLLFAISKATQRQLLQRFDQDRFPHPLPEIIVTPLGIDPFYQPSPDHQTEPKPWFVHVGGPHPRKDLPSLLEGFEKFLDQLHHQSIPLAQWPRLLLFGFPSSLLTEPCPGPTPDPEWGAAWGLPPQLAQPHPKTAQQVAVYGYVPKSILRLAYQKAFLLLFPSIEEGFGLPVLEAGACGCPSLVTETVAVAEDLPSDSRITVAVGDSHRLAQQLVDLWAQRQRRQGLATKILSATKLFSWDITVDTTLTALQRKVG
jgi:glycosyltransferase involved in cell wall biosynthesis